MQYFEAPPEVFEEPEVMRSWAQEAYGAVDKAKGTKTPNPSIERTRSGSAGLAFISFWAKPAPPPRAAHVKR